MLDEKKLKEAESRVKQYLRDGTIQTKQEGEFVAFFLNNASNSLASARALFDLSTNQKMQEYAGYPNFDGFLWVINASYYSMFYMARALLEHCGKSKIGITRWITSPEFASRCLFFPRVI